MRSILNILLILLCLFQSTRLKAQNLSDEKLSIACKNFHNGKFRSTANNHEVTIIIERKNDIQIETVEGKGTSKFKVDWTSECSYTLSMIESNIAEEKDMMGLKLEVIITAVNKNKYNFTCSIKGIDQVVTGEMEKMP